MTRNICVILQGKHLYMYCLSVAEVRLPHLYSNLISINTPQSVLDLLSPVYLNKILTELFNRLLPLHLPYRCLVVKSASLFRPAPLSTSTPRRTYKHRSGSSAQRVQVLYRPYAHCEFCGTKCSLKNRYSIYENVCTDTHYFVHLYYTCVYTRMYTWKTQKSFPQAIDILIKITQDTCATQFFSK